MNREIEDAVKFSAVEFNGEKYPNIQDKKKYNIEIEAYGEVTKEIIDFIMSHKKGYFVRKNLVNKLEAKEGNWKSEVEKFAGDNN